MKYRSVEEVRDNIGSQDFLVLDVREAFELDQWSLESALHIPLKELDQRAASLPKDKEISLLCERGPRAKMAARILKKKGFENLSVVKGGASRYRKKIK